MIVAVNTRFQPAALPVFWESAGNRLLADPALANDKISLTPRLQPGADKRDAIHLRSAQEAGSIQLIIFAPRTHYINVRHLPDKAAPV